MNELSKNSCLDLKQEHGTDNIKELLEKVDSQIHGRMTEKQERREYAITMQRRRDFTRVVEARRELKPKHKYFNYLQKRVLIKDITKEMEDKEETWGIDYGDYLHDLK